ncbi:MAG: hypothetical protein IT203_04020 [Fimbriimonadaceae bacterium]|nr:hypothetical protein [Fimbriimonadaceae bacterium]
MRPRPIVPPGKAGLLLIAVATVPLILGRCKPFAKRVGSKLVEWGEKLQKEDKEAAEVPTNSSAQEAEVDAARTSPSASIEEANKPIAPRTPAKKTPSKAKPATTKKSVGNSKSGAGSKVKKASAKPKT